MPAKPAWYAKLDLVVAELEALPRPAIDSATLEQLLGVGRRRAQQILAPCIRERLGANGLADRQELITHLRRVAAGDAAHYERRRRHQLATRLEQFRRSWLERPHVLVEAPVTILDQDFAGLPAGVHLEPGQIRVCFDHPTEALEKLFALAMAIGNDHEGFERRTAALPSQG